VTEVRDSESLLWAIGQAINRRSWINPTCSEMKMLLRGRESFESYDTFGELLDTWRWHGVTADKLQDFCAACLVNARQLYNSNRREKLRAVCALFGVVRSKGGDIEKYPIDRAATVRRETERPLQEGASFALGGLQATI
jgi:hypothetical protein